MENKSKIALVTGGSRGLGKDMALRLSEKGIDVVITYNSKEQEAADVVQQIQQNGQKAFALQLNTGDIKSFDPFIVRLKEVLQNVFKADYLDFLINNAGFGGHSAIQETTEELFDELLNVHFKGVYFLTQKALPLLADGGRIINISSGLTRFSFPGASAYASMKGAIEVFTRYLAKELAPRGIRANIVAPGAIATDFSGGRVRDDEQTNNFVSSMTALGRPGNAEDIGGVVAFLCSNEAGWITGQRLEVSGGMII
ncbi:SDR family NAD(P)-dependent oxidoreductase [Pedobacter nutrimenti]|uniref:NAD(P)-dependent dehydrogenase (Short-subunit alcohol dehydrogenase family) n=1 Tax=Pedobacter nutrimenti TaxID=1241337 RepID=A0A318UKY6_9SPHI|nr:SDR family oxidoreductase [Pedobacter nutrimenti]PYF77052.1 NAD(P)-dependent dehydrogenase (short-subunit alcohol dehydrogenase family) [Pedobacter nutrimenti]